MGLSASESVAEIHCAPGNAGTAEVATNHSFSEVSDLTQLAFQLDVDFVVAGPEAPLCDGLADRLAKMDIPCFGPVAALARLEEANSTPSKLCRQMVFQQQHSMF